MQVLQIWALFAGLVAAQLQQPLIGKGGSKAENKPNILFVLTDDQVAFVSLFVQIMFAKSVSGLAYELLGLFAIYTEASD